MNRSAIVAKIEEIAERVAQPEGIEIVEGALHGRQHDLWPGGYQQLFSGSEHLARRTDTYRVGDVEIAAAVAGHIDTTVGRRPEKLCGIGRHRAEV